MSDTDKLRDEIISFQIEQNKLLLWKLVSVGVVSSIALGLSKDTPGQPWLVSILPFLALYVDLLLRQLDLRIGVIAKYLGSKSGTEYEKYEAYLVTEDFLKIKAFELYHVAVTTSTALLCFLVICYGAINNICFVSVSGIFGLLLTLWVKKAYDRRIMGVAKHNFTHA